MIRLRRKSRRSKTINRRPMTTAATLMPMIAPFDMPDFPLLDVLEDDDPSEG
jgi:hypothetical protein